MVSFWRLANRFSPVEVSLLGSLCAAAQEKNNCIPLFTTVNTIARSVVDSQFDEVSGESLVVTQVPTTQAIDTITNDRPNFFICYAA